MHHKKYNFIKHLVNSKIAVMLQGPAGTGKTTIAMQIAEDLGLQFSSIALTKQTSKGDFLGFMSINSTAEEKIYIPTQFRNAVEFGHLFLLDEIDAGDPNTLLALNTLENGYIAFPDKVVQVHPNFRLMATANPINEHAAYTGRSKLDYSTLDRFFPVQVDRDDSLEISLTSSEIFAKISIIRDFLKSQGGAIEATMRDSIRIHKLITAGIDEEDPYEAVIFVKSPELLTPYKKYMKDEEAKIIQKLKEQEEARKEAERKAAYDKKTQAEVDAYSEYISKIQEGK